MHGVGSSIVLDDILFDLQSMEAMRYEPSHPSSGDTTSWSVQASVDLG